MIIKKFTDKDLQCPLPHFDRHTFTTTYFDSLHSTAKERFYSYRGLVSKKRRAPFDSDDEDGPFKSKGKGNPA
ncbi:MAG TPA: hypothetical protein VGF75_01700 [Candidatus Saccharimonadales bacterium]|jgi:hypothetical protein